MERLRGSDAQTIYHETPTSPFATLKVLVYEPTDKNDRPNFNEIKEFIRQGIGNWVNHGLGFRILRVPLDLHHPVWVKDQNFCLDDHIHHIALPSPGDKEALCAFISYVMSIPLDPNRPLWDSWIVDGLEGGKVAWVCKVHHVLADGVMSAEHIMDIHQQSNKCEPNKIDPLAFTPNGIPGKRKLLFEAMKDLIKSYTVEFPTYFREFKDAKTANKSIEAPENKTYGPFMAPYTFFNRLGGPYRTYRYETFSLSKLKILSRKLECTINDLVLTLCSEAMRSYYQEFDQLPNDPLVIVMPVGNRGNNTHNKFLNTEIQNNDVTIAFVPLDLQIPDIEDRLKQIKQGSRDAMAQVKRTNGVRMDSIADFMPGSFFRLMNWVLARRQNQRKSPMASAAISNVPGPRETLYACDKRMKMVELLSCGNLVDASAVGITVWSYMDNLCFSCFFRKGTLPQPERFTLHLHEAYEELMRRHADEPEVVKKKPVNTVAERPMSVVS